MTKNHILKECVRNSLIEYFEDLGSYQPKGILKMITKCIEEPVIELILEKTKGNQSQTAEILGISRNTLRKKMLLHNIHE
ncbi:DNA-binding protein Fis [Candidatus Kinetoplastibacterium sorsogonicusi]|uniref:Putative Fis-like DNA-binding protein n=1 Tax=Candidatus Kinetoplastidibacterium kentomonadis TaxID=1576550 RepID=A0A3Q8F3V1_9PROT|nr:helix-turn-helix domain-containing protein [Candidatus Kinetoplastibacterium sorsogonicusi]AWD32627.1 DNA-binding protein Fis [Candidatus Kinetoplastibacterium sorsogonicusi]